MLTYSLRRMVIGSVTLLLITFIIYALIRHMPGTPLTTDPSVQSLDRKMSDADYNRLKKIYGLDKPWWQAYFIWLGNAARLDFGRSFGEKRPVTRVIQDRVPRTLLLTVPSLLLMYLLSVPIGLWTTARRNLWDERIVSTLLYALYALPTFVAALVLLYYFYQRAAGSWWQLPPGIVSDGYDDMRTHERFVDVLRHMILPVTCYTYAGITYYSRFIKSNMEEVIRQDYIRTARAKGVAPHWVLLHHAFRNTLIPFVTSIGLTLPAILAGSVVIEYVFSWPGMGTLLLDSIGKRDYPVIMAITLIFSIMTLLGQLVADLLYAVVDPRISYS